MSVQVNPLFQKTYLTKPVCPRNINSSRSIRLNNVCHSKSNVSPSKSVCPSKTTPKPFCKPVWLSKVTPSKPIRSSSTSLSKSTCLSKVYSRTLVCPVNICQSKSACLSNISLSKPTCGTTVLPSKAVHPINVCPSKPVCSSNVNFSKPVCPCNDCQSKPFVL